MRPGGERSISYQPALDGIRAVSVIVVLLFHLGLEWISGGYLGVSVFFTLSGFLITTLLLRELDQQGTVRLRRFYGRRARRLLPASIICLIGVCILIANDLAPDRSGLRWYVFGALFQFANWVPLALSDSYGELFDALSPTDHFWSLAIEEQFYWLWPLAMIGLFRLIRGRELSAAEWTKRLTIAIGALFVIFAISAPLTAQLWNEDAAYFATWARIPEILAGALLAVVAHRVQLPRRVSALAPICLAAVIALCLITPAGRGFAYQGGLPLFALLSVGLIAGVQQPSPTRTLLSTPPLVWIGKVSYGIYLYHWPVYIVLTEARTELSVWPLSILRIAVTLAIAFASYVLIEQPIRERRFLPTPQLALSGVGVAVAAVAVLGLSSVSNTSSFESTGDTLPPVEGTTAPLVTDPPVSSAPTTTTQPETTPPTTTPDSSAPTTTAAPVATTTTLPATTTTEALVPPRPVRMLIVGDSTAQVTGVALGAWAEDNPDLAAVEVQAFGGCGILDEGDRFFRGEWEPTSPGCVGLLNETVPARVAAIQADIVVVVTSFWDSVDHRWPGEDIARNALDPVFQERTEARFTEYNQMLLDAGAPRVVWVLYPRLDSSWEDADETSDDPARYPPFYEIQRDAARPFPGEVGIIDLAGWTDAEGLTDDRDARPDGVHWDPEVGIDIADRWLGNEIIQAALH